MIYQSKDYRKGILEIIERRRQAVPKLTFAQIAAAAKLQPTYFSNVLKGRAQFSSDQLFLICQTIQADPQESDYLQLLLEWARCQIPARRELLNRRIEDIRQANLQTQKHLQARPATVDSLLDAEYYLDPVIQLVHLYLNIRRYAVNHSLIADELGLSKERLQFATRTLEKLGYVTLEKGQYRCLVKNRHLPQNSPVCLPHQILLRLKSAEQLSRLPEQKRYHVSVSFSTQLEVLEQIRAEFLKFLKRAEALVAGTPEEKVCQLNFDLFPWSLL